MKKILVILLLLFSSVFGTCFENYKKMYYYQGVYSSIAAFAAQKQDLIDITKMNDDEIFYASNDSIIKIVKEKNYTNALKYIEMMNKRNINIPKQDFLNGFASTPKMVKNIMHKYKVDGEQAMYNARMIADIVFDESLRELNNCKVVE